MYERNAIVLEKYLNNIFEQKNGINFKNSLESLKDILDETQKYIEVTIEEEKIIKEFEEIARKMQNIQKRQEELCLNNIKSEEERNKLFTDLENPPEKIEKSLILLEEKMQDNFIEEKDLRTEYVELLKKFVEKQEKRNKCAKEKRAQEKIHIKMIENINERISNVQEETVEKISGFIKIDDKTLADTLYKVIMNNGKNEKIKFNENVVEKAVNTRIKIAKKESECYIIIYTRLKKLIAEIENDNLKIKKYLKTYRDCSTKLNFLTAEKEYISNFLDNERMASINGEKIHKKMMDEACKNFDLDIKQIENLYLLILREVSNKSTKKAYKELYNATYLKNIEETERKFNKEVNSIKANIGTIINSNYWRIDGIKNVYEVFNYEVQEKFNIDLSEFLPEEEKELMQEVNNLFISEENNSDDEEQEEIEEWFISNDEFEEKEKLLIKDKKNKKSDEKELDFEDDEYIDFEDDEDLNFGDEDEDDEFDFNEEDEEDEELDFDEEDEDEEFNFDDEDEEDFELDDEDEEDFEIDEEDIDEFDKTENKNNSKQRKNIKENKDFDLEENLNEKIKKLKGEDAEKEEKNTGLFGRIFKDKKN